MARDRDDRDDRGRDDDRGRGRDRDDDRGRGRDDDRGRGRGDDDRGASRGRKGGGNSYTYKRRSPEEIKKHGEKGGGLWDNPFKDGVKTYRPKKGEGLFRIMPPTWEGHDHYGLKVFMHRFVGAQSSNYLCSEKMNTGKPCACCDEMRRMKKAGATKEELRDINPQERYLYYVVDRDEKADEPSVLDVSWSQDRAIYEQTQSERTGETLYIDDPDDGYDIIVKKTGEGMTNTKYSWTVARNTSPLDRSIKKQEDLMAFAIEHPLTDVLRFDTYEHIEKNLFGTVAAKDEAIDDRGRDDDRGSRGRDRDDADRGRGDRGGGRDRDDGGSRGRDPDDAPRGRSRLDDDDDRGGDRDRGRDRGRDDDDRGGRGRPSADDDRGRDDTRGRGRGDDRDDTRARGRDRDDDDDRGRDDRGGRDRDRDRDDDDRGGTRERSRR